MAAHPRPALRPNAQTSPFQTTLAQTPLPKTARTRATPAQATRGQATPAQPAHGQAAQTAPAPAGTARDQVARDQTVLAEAAQTEDPAPAGRLSASGPAAAPGRQTAIPARGEPSAAGEPPKPRSGQPSDGNQADHLPVGGFCGCCGAVYPCATARRKARNQPLAQQFLAPMSRLAQLRAESVAPAH